MSRTRLSLYADVQPVLERALLGSGGTAIFATHKEAVAWRLRAYRFRKAYYDATGSRKYDDLVFPRIPDDETVVTITTRQVQPVRFVPNENSSPAPVDFEELARKIDKGDIV